MVAVFLPCLFDLVNYSVTLKFVLANLKYSGVLLESYFSISHIAHKACLDYILINLYSLYFAVGDGHFADTIIVKQIFLVSAHLYGVKGQTQYVEMTLTMNRSQGYSRYGSVPIKQDTQSREFVWYIGLLR